MSKDYAKRSYANSRAPKKKRLRVELYCLLVVLLLAICAAGFWLYKHKTYTELTENQQLNVFFTKVKSLFHHQNVVHKLAQADHAFPEESAKEDVHFDFYTELPNMQVTIPASDKELTKSTIKLAIAKADSKKADSKNVSGKYILEFGMFKEAPDASQLRLSLLLAECESEIIKVNTDEGDVYRVQSIAYTNIADAKSLQRELEKKGVMGVVKKLTL